MGQARFSSLAYAFCAGDHSMVSQHRMCHNNGLDPAPSTVLDLVSLVYYSVCYLWLGSMDPQINRHGGQLLAVGHH